MCLFIRYFATGPPSIPPIIKPKVAMVIPISIILETLNCSLKTGIHDTTFPWPPCKGVEPDTIPITGSKLNCFAIKMAM